MGGLKPHPTPPADLNQRAPLIRNHEGLWYRIHWADKPAIYFGKSCTSRFDAPGQEFGVLYMAEQDFGAFIETFGQETGVRSITRSALGERKLSLLTTDRPLKLINLAGRGGLARIGADLRLCSDGHDLSQMWSLALHQHPVHADGILYSLRHDSAQLGCALFDRYSGKVKEECLGHMDSQELANRIAEILACYDYGLVE